MSDDDTDDSILYALTYHTPEGRQLYWSLRKGWTTNVDAAWALSQFDIDRIEEDDRLLAKLPQHKERKDGANWEPVYQRLSPYAPGVFYDDDDDLFSTLNGD